MRRLLELLLKTSGYDTVTATNGVEALEQMRRQLPCVVPLDMNMPVMDGFAFRRQQLADPHLTAVDLPGLFGPLIIGEQRSPSPCRPLHPLSRQSSLPPLLDAVGCTTASTTALTSSLSNSLS